MSHFYKDIHNARIGEARMRIKKEIVMERIPLQAEVAVTHEPVPYKDRLSLKYRPIKVGEAWGENFDCGWFHITGQLPKSWAGSYVTLNLDMHGELLLFDKAGCPLVGLTNGSVFDEHFNKDQYHWLPCAKGSEKVDFWCDAGANYLFGVDRAGDPDWEEDKSHLFGHWNASVVRLSACRFDVEKWRLFIDLEVIQSLLKSLPDNSSRYIRVLRETSKALDLLPPELGGAPAVREHLKKTVFAVDPDPAATKVSALGHAHIDTAWLWPYRETKRKVARTWSSQIGLIAKYPAHDGLPGYKFGASQAQLYKYCKDEYPKLYAKVKDAVRRGDWEVQGAMWVEADCNIPSGESLIRQCLEGCRFFTEEFGSAPRNLWLPDVFGYSGNLPQILRICGVDFFLTQKLSWNRYNKFPHNSFVWEGIDGSKVVSHFPPEDSYIAFLLPDQLRRHDSLNREAGIVDTAISLFGIGDGGGGPKEEYVERGFRCGHLNGCPPVRYRFAQEAMDEIATSKDDLDVWKGELYFEMHRGTYTTQARQKMLNRRSEEAMRAAEALCATASHSCGMAYPAKAFSDLWRDICLCQFHDVIPGSSIHRVYSESAAILENAIAKAGELEEKAARKLLRRDASAAAVFNPSSTPFRGVVELPEGWKGAVDGDGNALPSQVEGDKVLALADVAPNSFGALRKADGAAQVKPVAAKKFPVVLENDLVRYEIDAAGRVVRAVDKTAAREFINPGRPANVVRMYDDHPSCYDAWDIEEYLYNMPVADPADVKVCAFEGPVRSGAVVKFTLGKSTFEQCITLEAGSKRLDFATHADWREKHKVSRVSFPVDVVADEARFEIQYGTIARATHDNTKWQYAQFESLAHRYADLHDGLFGVALLNDCKYGYRVKGSEMSMTLLRAPTEPDLVADVGEHDFTYSILPHVESIAVSDDVVAAAAVLNQGVDVFAGYAPTAKAESPVVVEGDGVELAVLKGAEDGNGLVVRLVERRGVRSSARLALRDGEGVATPILATELKDAGDALALPAALDFRPFEIKTFRIVSK